MNDQTLQLLEAAWTGLKPEQRTPALLGDAVDDLWVEQRDLIISGWADQLLPWTQRQPATWYFEQNGERMERIWLLLERYGLHYWEIPDEEDALANPEAMAEWMAHTLAILWWIQLDAHDLVDHPRCSTGALEAFIKAKQPPAPGKEVKTDTYQLNLF